VATEAVTADAPTDRISRANLAALFEVDERTITNLAKEGMPKLSPGFFSLAASVRWYLKRERDKARAGRELNDLDLARKRKAIADAELAEHELATTRGEKVSLSAIGTTWSEIASGLRAQLLAVPGRYAPRTVGCNTLVESQRAWDAAIADVIGELRDG
jgi:phage terminase Nu1 subunit (DNA packaging protein)